MRRELPGQRFVDISGDEMLHQCRSISCSFELSWTIDTTTGPLAPLPPCHPAGQGACQTARACALCNLPKPCTKVLTFQSISPFLGWVYSRSGPGDCSSRGWPRLRARDVIAGTGRPCVVLVRLVCVCMCVCVWRDLVGYLKSTPGPRFNGNSGLQVKNTYACVH